MALRRHAELIPFSSHSGNRWTSGNDLATAELFDPANGTFAPAGNMEIERTERAATLLMNGTVLMTGGINGDNIAGLNSLASAELFP